MPNSRAIFGLIMNPEHIPLRDLHLPDMIGWWPVAPVVLLLFSLLLFGLGFILWRPLLTHQMNADIPRTLSHTWILQVAHDRLRDAGSLGAVLAVRLC